VNVACTRHRTGRRRDCLPTQNVIEPDFISFLIPPDDELLPVVDAALAEIESRNLNKYSPNHNAKAKIHTWLAWQETPGAPMGLSITRKYLTTDGETCSRLMTWLQDLFHMPG
jgi:hypothetical protein